MRHMTKSPKTITSAFEKPGAQLGIAEAECGGEVESEGTGPVVASRHHLGDPNGASKLDWSVFKQEKPEQRRAK